MSGTYKKIVFNGRKVLFYFPSTFDKSKPCDILLAFHGLWSKAIHMRDTTGLVKKAEAKNFVLICPNGQGFPGKGWNAGTCCSNLPDTDVDIVKVLLDEIKASHVPNFQKLFLVGMSNGAMLAHRLGYELNGYQIAGIATISGTLAIETDKPGQQTYPIPIIHFHGTKDKIVSINGITKPSFLSCKSVSDTLVAWQKRNNTVSHPKTEKLPDLSPTDGTHVYRENYKSNGAGKPVVFIKIKNGGHTWPGHAPPDIPLVTAIGALGRYTKDINAEDLMWEFFEKYI